MAARTTKPQGKKPDKFMRDALIVALHREHKADDGTVRRYLNRVADTLVRKAASGDVQAIKEIFDRVEGRAPQTISGPEGGPIEIERPSDVELARRIAFLLVKVEHDARKAI